MPMRELPKYTARPPQRPFIFPIDPGRIYFGDLSRDRLMRGRGSGGILCEGRVMVQPISGISARAFSMFLAMLVRVPARGASPATLESAYRIISHDLAKIANYQKEYTGTSCIIDNRMIA